MWRQVFFPRERRAKGSRLVGLQPGPGRSPRTRIRCASDLWKMATLSAFWPARAPGLKDALEGALEGVFKGVLKEVLEGVLKGALKGVLKRP